MLIAVACISNLYMLSRIEDRITKTNKILLEKSRYDMKYQTAVLKAKQFQLVEKL